MANAISGSNPHRVDSPEETGLPVETKIGTVTIIKTTGKEKSFTTQFTDKELFNSKSIEFLAKRILMTEYKSAVRDSDVKITLNGVEIKPLNREQLKTLISSSNDLHLVISRKRRN